MNKLEKLEFILKATLILMVSMIIASIAHLDKFFINAKFGHLFFSIIYIIASVATGYYIHLNDTIVIISSIFYFSSLNIHY